MPSESSRATIAIWVVAALIGVFALARLTADRGSGAGAPVQVRRAGPAAGAGAGAGKSAQGTIYVHVAGAVRAPGLLKLAPGARVATAVSRAGGPGPKADLSGVNLAAKLEDGQQVLVPVRGAAPAASGTAGGPALAGAPEQSLATATVEQLDQVDGIGPTLAQRIVEYRTEHNGFRSLGELREVEGIGEKRFETLSEALQP